MLNDGLLNKLNKYAEECADYDNDIERIIVVGDMKPSYILSHCNILDIFISFNGPMNKKNGILC